VPVDSKLIERFRTVVDLWDTGVAIRRQAIRRAMPWASDDEVEERLRSWLQERPGAEQGDGPQLDQQ
jgi:hypothetical protein